MKIVLVNHYAGSPAHGMEFRPHQFARQWVAAGHDVVVIAGSYSHLRNMNPVFEGSSSSEYIDGIEYRWLKTPIYHSNGIARIRSIRTFLAAVERERRSLLSKTRVDAVIASSTYPFDIDPARRIARDHDALLVWEVHDLWPLSPMELGGFSKWNPLIWVTQRAEDRCCRDADLVVSILPKTLEHLRSRGLAKDRFVTIPNGAEPEPPPARIPDAQKSIEHHRENGRFTIAYAGGIGGYHGLESLIRAFATLDPETVAMVLVGDGPEKERLERLASDLGCRHVEFHDRVPRSEALAIIASADAIFVGLHRHSIYRFGIGLNKIYDAMLAARPVIASYSAGNDPIGEAGCGITVPAEDVSAIAEAIRRVRSMPVEERSRYGDAGAAFVREHHDFRMLADRFIVAMEEARARKTGADG